MTRRIGNIVLIEPEPDSPCELCGDVRELRPYGPNGKSVCLPCAQKNPEALERHMRALFDGAESTRFGRRPREPRN